MFPQIPENMFDLDVLLFPIHVASPPHWVTGVINFAKTRIEVYDSLNLSGVPEKICKVIHIILQCSRD